MLYVLTTKGSFYDFAFNFYSAIEWSLLTNKYYVIQGKIRNKKDTSRLHPESWTRPDQHCNFPFSVVWRIWGYFSCSDKQISVCQYCQCNQGRGRGWKFLPMGLKMWRFTKPNEFVCNRQSFAVAGKTCIEVKVSKHISDKTMFQINAFIILLT